MAKLTLEVPTVGEKNTVAEPKVDTALKAIETWANGEVGTANIAAENVSEAMLTKALQEKLTTKIGLTLELKNESFEAVAEKWYIQEKEGATITLPKPTANRMIAVTCANTIKAFKLKPLEGKIYSGLHPAGATVVEVTESASLIVEATGINWFVLAGEEKREQAYSAQTARTLGTEYEPSATRPTFVTLEIVTNGEVRSSASLFVGGVRMGGVQLSKPAEGNATGMASFICPPGLKWKAENVVGSPTVNSSYLTL